MAEVRTYARMGSYGVVGGAFPGGSWDSCAGGSGTLQRPHPSVCQCCCARGPACQLENLTLACRSARVRHLDIAHRHAQFFRVVCSVRPNPAVGTARCCHAWSRGGDQLLSRVHDLRRLLIVVLGILELPFLCTCTDICKRVSPVLSFACAGHCSS